MAGSRTASALLLLLAAAAFDGCWAKDFHFIFGKGGKGGNGGKVVQLSTTNQAGIANAAQTLQKANANGGAGGDGVDLSGEGFPDSFIVGTGGNGGNGGTIYQKSVTNQAGAFNAASTTQEANANGGAGGDGVTSGRKLLVENDLPDILFLVGKGGNGGNGGTVVQYSKTTQVGLFNKAKTTQKANANGGNGGAGIGRKLLEDGSIFVFAGQGGNGGKGGFIGQFSTTNQLGFVNKAKTTQKANANGGNGGDGISG